MKSMLIHYARVLLAGALVVGLVGLLRLGGQFPAAADSPGLLIPFLTPVLALALEAGALVALSAAVLRLLHQAPPASLAARARAAVPVLGLLALTLAVAELVPRGTERPGALANDLVARAQAGCRDAISSVPVPLLGLSVRCSEPPRVEGPMPGAGSIQLGMRQLRFSDDLRSVHITDLELSAKRALHVKLRVGTARIVGLSPWTRSPRLAPLTRFFVLSAVAASLWLTALGMWRPPPAAAASPPPRWLRWVVTVLFAIPGAAAAAFVITLDQQQAEPVRYGLSALAGIGALVLVRVLAWRAPQLFGSVSAF